MTASVESLSSSAVPYSAPVPMPGGSGGGGAVNNPGGVSGSSASSSAAAAAAAAAVNATVNANIPNAAGGNASSSPMTLKAKEEILTSLHLIKDIRRLEKYQRDFFLKVKESMNHVQVLLDHQLMDMAWSDKLIECEESLLKASVHLSSPASSSTPLAQVNELYAWLLQDRETLRHRFQELSVKSSLSEYVVNARALLDIDTVHVATEAILRNEKPVLAKSNKTIPVDHAFFLANFCTTSIASSMFPTKQQQQQQQQQQQHQRKSQQPQQQQQQQPNDSSYHSAMYDPHNAGVVGKSNSGSSNGGSGSNVSSLKQQQQQSPQQAQQQQSADKFYGGGAGVQVSTVGQDLASSLPLNANANSGLYNGGSADTNMSKFGGGGVVSAGGAGGANANVAVTSNDNVNVGDLSAKSNMFSGHELVSAISQITRNDASPNKSKKSSDPWGNKDSSANVAAAAAMMFKQENGSVANAPVTTGSGSSNIATGYMGHNGYNAAAASNAGQPPSESNSASSAVMVAAAAHDASSESVTSESDDGRGVNVTAAAMAAAASQYAAANAATPVAADYDSSKPLSFARIASLNLEKQAVQRPTSSTSSSVGGVNMVAAAGVLGAGPDGGANKSMMIPALQVPPQSLSAVAANQHQLAGSLPSSAAVAAAAAAAAGNMPNAPSSLVPSTPPATGATLPLISLPPTNNPRYVFEIMMEGKRLGKVVIEVQPGVAPKMAQNFGMLVTGERGFGYKGCQFFQAWKNESVICGDWEHNSGRGGRAALDGGPLFTPDETRLTCLRGAVGMRRMSKKHSSLNQVASQFRIILANMNSQFTGIFGHVVSGIEALDKVANIGGEGGRPEKIAHVSNCGIYKPSQA